MIWLDRIGLLLQFVAFFLVAPEVIGEHRLRKLGRRITVGDQLTLLVPISAAVVIGTWAVLFRIFDEEVHRLRIAAGLSLLVVALIFGCLAVIRRHLVQRLIDAMGDREALRRLSLSLGAISFSVGFVLQFVATFR